MQKRCIKMGRCEDERDRQKINPAAKHHGFGSSPYCQNIYHFLLMFNIFGIFQHYRKSVLLMSSCSA